MSGARKRAIWLRVEFVATRKAKTMDDWMFEKSIGELLEAHGYTLDGENAVRGYGQCSAPHGDGRCPHIGQAWAETRLVTRKHGPEATWYSYPLCPDHIDYEPTADEINGWFS